MIKKFIPEYYFDTFDQADAEFLSSIGIKGVVLDVDNTLEPYENALPGEHVIAWLDSLKAVGISTAIVSNNNGERISIFNEKIGMPAYFKAGKPSKKRVLSAMTDMGTTVDETILIGDQIFTDVWAAHNAGIKAVLVKPIRDKRDLLTRFKRLLERPVIRAYYKRKEKEK